MWGSSLRVGSSWPVPTVPIRRRGKSRRAFAPPTLVLNDSLPTYHDSGDATCYCSYCGAYFWYEERVLLGSRVGRPVYNQCCKGGSVVLPAPVSPPSALVALYEDSHFMRNIRAYNSMFSMTLFGAKVDGSVNVGHGPYTFKVSGQVSHYIGSLCPVPPSAPRFLQLYVYDTLNSVQNRLRFFPAADNDDVLKADVVTVLTNLLLSCNEYVRTFTRAVEIADYNNVDDFAVRLYSNVPDGRYAIPQPGTLGAIVVAEDANANAYDIIIRSKSDRPCRISKLHQSYMPLQYPLLFPYGEVGWSPSLKLRSVSGRESRSLTVNMYYSYLLHSRRDVFSLLLRGGRLLQQFLLDAYLCLEDSRLDYIRNHQNSLRSEYAAGVFDAISRGDSMVSQIGKRVFLPSSFVGGPRYMYKHYQDALALCRVYGNPQYFITFTCNANWPEISRFMDSHSMGHSQNRPDIIARVFSMKVSNFVKFLKEDKPFGVVSAYLYTVEFQKRGLPHCHTLLWVEESFRIRNPVDVDKYITAKLPNPITEPRLYSTITKSMIHGPCGLPNSGAPCMRDGTCKKRFPKQFALSTFFDKDGALSAWRFHYKKADTSAHPNSKKSGSSTSHSVAAATEKTVNEIENFVDGRFICPHEAAWRLLNFSIHEREPAVQVLHVHLEHMQTVTFQDGCDLQMLTRNANFGSSTLSRWLISNRWDPDGRHLTYVQYPLLFSWNAGKKEWIFRTKKIITPIGRMVYIHPTAGELFYLRMLLCHQKGCCTFSDIRSVNGVVYSSYRLACEALGLVGDDKEWLTAFNEASFRASSIQLRSLFCNLLLFCDVSDPKILWNNAWPKMGDDIVHILSTSATSSDSVIPEATLQQHILLELEKILNAAVPSKSLTSFDLPPPSSDLLLTLRNRLLLEETLYCKILLRQQHLQMSPNLNSEQLRVYDRIRNDEAENKQTMLFVYGHGGTGKTYLWSTILAYFRSTGKVVLAVASSGIASLLLPNGRTAHSRFNIPIDLTNISVCNIKKKTQLSELLQQTHMIVWDEATMMDRKCFECVDRTFRDILDKKEKPFGGISMILGGDFRQTLPIKRKKGHQDIMLATLPNSYLWPYFSLYKLSYNMRLSRSHTGDSICTNSSLFAQWLLDVGNGTIGFQDTLNSKYASQIQIPDGFLIKDSVCGLQQLIDFVYGPSILLAPTRENLCNRAIICPKNCTTDDINSIILDSTSERPTSYYSSDSITPHTRATLDLELLYPEEYLNQLNFPSLPLHRLDLKQNVPIILLRNMNQKNGLWNGTRLIVTKLLPTIIEAVIMTGTCIGQKVFLPRIKFVHHDPELPFTFTRKQFPCKISYAMTINKSQGKSLQRIVIFLPFPIFGHGQLYVALSRATSPDSVKVFIKDENAEYSDHTRNIVYKDFLCFVDNLQNI